MLVQEMRSRYKIMMDSWLAVCNGRVLAVLNQQAAIWRSSIAGEEARKLTRALPHNRPLRRSNSWWVVVIWIDVSLSFHSVLGQASRVKKKK